MRRKRNRRRDARSKLLTGFGGKFVGNYLWVGIGGFLGAVARYGISGIVSERYGTGFPLGTLTVNVTGAFLLAFIATVATRSGLMSPPFRIGVSTGFLGAYTTFSTWSLETLRLLETGSYMAAGANVAGSIALGFAGAWLGVLTARVIS